MSTADQVNDPHDLRDIHHRAVARAERALERARLRRPNEMLPRVEVVRTRFRAAIEILTMAGSQVEDLYEIAYNRRAAADRLDVQGGSKDYALDTHGDPLARQLYRQASWELLDLIEDSAEAAHDIVKFFKTGALVTGRRRTAGDASPAELAEALEAQARRGRRAGLETQPTVKGAPTLSSTLEELKHLRSAVAKVHPERLTSSQKKRFTRAEAAAWQAAVPQPIGRERQARERPAGGWER